MIFLGRDEELPCSSSSSSSGSTSCSSKYKIYDYDTICKPFGMNPVEYIVRSFGDHAKQDNLRREYRPMFRLIKGEDYIGLTSTATKTTNSDTGSPNTSTTTSTKHSNISSGSNTFSSDRSHMLKNDGSGLYQATPPSWPLIYDEKFGNSFHKFYDFHDYGNYKEGGNDGGGEEEDGTLVLEYSGLLSFLEQT